MGKLTKKRVEEAIRASRGVLTEAARALGVSRQGLYAAIQRHGLEGLLREVREEFLDDVENRLIQAALAGKPWAVMFVLKTIGKERGYTERVEQFSLESVDLRIVDE
jgi:hypothetical protein